MSSPVPVATDALDVLRLAGSAAGIAEVNARISECRACPRLVAWREQVAREKRRAFADQVYWGRAVPGFGDPDARLLIVGLAPAAHGGNRTGRMFTGDRSGDWLYAALHRAGFANQATSVSKQDGLRLDDAYIAAPVRCAPPANKPTTEERDTCRPWMAREIELMWPGLRVIVVLGAFGWAALWPTLRAAGIDVPKRIAPFGHGVEMQLDGRHVLGCYHVSQQNTFTGRLTEPMLDALFARARALASVEA